MKKGGQLKGPPQCEKDVVLTMENAFILGHHPKTSLGNEGVPDMSTTRN